MKKEYPTVDGLQAVLKVLKSLDFTPTYIQQELIRAELQKYRLEILKETFGIDKDPVPAAAVETSSPEGEKGIFILFVNPLDFVELVEKDGTPTPKEKLSDLAFLALIGLYISKDNPEKIEIGMAPVEILLKLKEPPKKEDEKVIIEEKFTGEKKDNNLLN